MPSENSKTSFLVIYALLGLVSFLLFVPIYPVMPRIGLDSSWIFAANEAVARNLVFGKDFIYTVGPYSAVWTQAYHPATYGLAITCGSLMAIGYFYMSFALFRQSHRLWQWAYVVFLFFMMVSRDGLFLFYPLLLTFLIYRNTLSPEDRNFIGVSHGGYVLLFLVASTLGLQPLVKLSFIPLAVGASVISSLLLWRAGRLLPSVCMVLLPVIAMPLFWAISGQPINALPDYFINNAAVVAGFTQAMSNNSNYLELAIFILASMLILGTLYRARLVGLSVNGLLLLLMIVLFLFMSFKAGFVRLDVHARTASTNIVMLLFLVGTFRGIELKGLPVVITTAFALWLIVYYQTINAPFEYYKPIGSRLWSMARDTINGNGLQRSTIDRYRLSLAKIRSEHPLPVFPGSADIYPWDDASLIASGNVWNPRPSLQSFAAYTPGLEIADLRHLTGAHAPDTVFFSVQTIDGRYPSMDDGAGWPVLLSQYRLTEMLPNELVLRKRSAPPNIQPMVQVLSGFAHLGKEVDLERYTGSVYAEIIIRPTLLERIANILYKPTALQITVNLSNGVTRKHRFVPGEAETGFLLSPYVASTNAFKKLEQGPEVLDSLPRVNGFRIEERPYSLGMWAGVYTIKLFRLADQSIPFGSSG